MQTDEQFIAEYLEGKDEALTQLVDRYLENAVNFAYRLTADRQAAEDITQQAFIKAWRNIRSFRKGGNFQSWLFAITRNTAIDWLRKKRELVLSSFENQDGTNTVIDALVDEELLPDELIAKAEDNDFVRNILTSLDPKYREVLLLRYSEYLTFAEIGKLLKKPLHTIKSQHRRALAAIKRSLQIKQA